MRRRKDLEERLRDWASAYAGGSYDLDESIRSPMGQAMKWGGRPPTGLGQIPATPEADEVQDAVHALAVQPDGRVPAAVLRCEYFHPGWAMDHKLDDLRSDGFDVPRTRYYQHLQSGRKYVAGWLRIPFSLDPSLLVDMLLGD